MSEDDAYAMLTDHDYSRRDLEDAAAAMEDQNFHALAEQLRDEAENRV